MHPKPVQITRKNNSDLGTTVSQNHWRQSEKTYLIDGLMTRPVQEKGCYSN
jgi:hypothetical protein